MIKNTLIAYGSIGKIFHWGSALLIVLMIGVAYIMINVSGGPLKWALYDMHKATGLTLFILTLGRFIWRKMNPIPSYPTNMPIWQKKASNATLIFLYFLLFCLPISGFLMSVLQGHSVSYYGLLTFEPWTLKSWIGAKALEAHEALAYLLIAAGILHICAALYHHFVLKDTLLRRMLPGKER